MSTAIALKDLIRSIPDFPKPGIMFRDITPILASPVAFRQTITDFKAAFESSRPTAILAAESRGFLFGAPLALELGCSFVPVRKPGKLPFQTHRFDYDLEYGSDSLEIHVDAIGPGSRVLLIDDLLATGGTIDACARLCERAGAEVVGFGFVIELTFLNGRKRLRDYPVVSLVQYADEN